MVELDILKYGLRIVWIKYQPPISILLIVHSHFADYNISQVPKQIYMYP